MVPSRLPFRVYLLTQSRKEQVYVFNGYYSRASLTITVSEVICLFFITFIMTVFLSVLLPEALPPPIMCTSGEDFPEAPVASFRNFFKISFAVLDAKEDSYFLIVKVFPLFAYEAKYFYGDLEMKTVISSCDHL
ncbi:hypothetical protein [Metabacillus arenae]|uniref:Uncharacterized protein n=1 Tax=Metabacillus arenae TaxID=2771434 RepID=A0A926NLP1_9BACI|nr:hypothetical protein [Metabacillus arenae]MBD1382253.1 hypothetical protein [Metabacillus arenae]